MNGRDGAHEANHYDDDVYDDDDAAMIQDAYGKSPCHTEFDLNADEIVGDGEDWSSEGDLEIVGGGGRVSSRPTTASRGRGLGGVRLQQQQQQQQHQHQHQQQCVLLVAVSQGDASRCPPICF